MYSVVNERVGVLFPSVAPRCVYEYVGTLENSRLPVRLARVAVGATRDFRSEQAMAVLCRTLCESNEEEARAGTDISFFRFYRYGL